MTVWRQGRQVGHHLYLQHGGEPSAADRWLGSFVDPQDAARAVVAVNGLTSDDTHVPRIEYDELLAESTRQDYEMTAYRALVMQLADLAGVTRHDTGDRGRPELDQESTRAAVQQWIKDERFRLGLLHGDMSTTVRHLDGPTRWPELAAPTRDGGAG